MGQLTEQERELLTYLKKKGPKTASDLSKELFLNESTIRRRLAILKNEGLIFNYGKKPVVYEASLIPPAKLLVDENGEMIVHPDVLGDPSVAAKYFSGPQEAESTESEQEDNPQANNPQRDSETKPSQDNSFPKIAVKRSLIHHGHNVHPCFNVDGLAQAFVSVIDSVSSPKSDSISMLGIFGAWGRGKTYFFNVVKDHLSQRNHKEIHYDIIEFNAWKYQSTPAIWASLFETIYHYKSRFFRFWFSVKRSFIPFLRDILLCFLVPISVKLFSLFSPALKKWAEDNNIALWSLLVSLLAYSISLIAKHQKEILTIIQKYIKGVSFAEHLGVQAEIERSLTDYLKTWICEKKSKTKKILLYVEDVDRCERSKMLDILESLRTILEQPDIRKRLIVVVSLDSKVFWSALDSRFSGIKDDTQLHETIINHFDKLFTASISLPQLNIDDELDYLKEIANQRPPKTIFRLSLSEEPVISSPKDKAFIQPRSHIIKEIVYNPNADQVDLSSKNDQEQKSLSLDYTPVYNLISKSLNNYKRLHLTPRQLSCIYYRSLLAINLISTMKKDIIDIDSSLTDQIIVRSYMYHNMTEYKKTSYEDELDMVIPYPVTITR